MFKRIHKNPLLLLPLIAGIYIFFVVFEKEPVEVLQAPSQEEVEGVRDEIGTGSARTVIDGDTIELQNGERVRYLGINTPESGQPYFEEAKNENRRLVHNKELRFEYEETRKDQYGRTLGYIFEGDVFINRELLRKGLATTEFFDQDLKYESELRQAEEFARTNCQGLWKGLCEKDTATSCVILDSIHADAEGDDSKNKNGEWVEIENQCAVDIQLKGFMIKDSSASNYFTFPDYVLSVGKSVRLRSGCGASDSENIYWQCPERRSAVWNNEGDKAFLYNPSGLLVAYLEY